MEKKELVKVENNDLANLENELKDLLKTRNIEQKEQIKKLLDEQINFEQKLNEKIAKIEKLKSEEKPKDNTIWVIFVTVVATLFAREVFFKIFGF